MLARCRTDQDIADLACVVAEIESVIGAASANDTGDGLVPDPVLWSGLTHRFHELIMQRSGNKTLALQGAVLHDIVATHIELRVSRNFDRDESPERFRRAVKAYKKLVSLIEERDADGAERLWRSHMESAAEFLLKDDLRDKPVVELFA
jgi:DNA-binding GntR family transcriptional regulator